MISEKELRVYDTFMAWPLFFFKLTLLTQQTKQSTLRIILQILHFLNGFLFVLLHILYVIFAQVSASERYEALTLVPHCVTGLGKLLTISLMRLKLVDIMNELEILSPSKSELRIYNLNHFLRTYKKIETLQLKFTKYLVGLYIVQPMIESFIALWRYGQFGYFIVMQMWPAIPFNFFTYAIWYIMTLGFSNAVTWALFTTDLILMSFLTQLCINFELLAKGVMELEPAHAASLKKLKSIIEKHQRILRLAKNLANVFMPSLFLTLSSSSFAMCFMAYRMLDEISLFEAIKAFLTLCYELKQITIICYFGSKLLESSARFFDAIYEHEWYEGSPEYRRLVIFLLMNTRRPVGLKVAITTVSFVCLKQILSNSYQMFAVMKTAS